MATRKAANKPEPSTIEIPVMYRDTFHAALIGTSPLLCNAFSEKARQQILMPPKKKNQAEKAMTLKHDIETELGNSVYVVEDEGLPLVGIPSTAFKSAMCDAALDIPGAHKSQMGRLTWVEGEFVAIFGIPMRDMRPVRNSDPNRTPDIRTRAILPRWACQLTISFVQPALKQNVVAALLSAAGMIQGVGDGRQGKGKLSYGQFRVVDPKDNDFRALLRQGRKAQEEAMDDPQDYNEETRRLRTWYNAEVSRREMVKEGIAKAPLEGPSITMTSVRKPIGTARVTE